MVEFKKLSELEQVETASDNATVLIEEDGEVKRVLKNKVGGGGLTKTLVFKNEYYDAALSPDWELPDGSFSNEYECNMTFSEIYNNIRNGEVLSAVVLAVLDGDTIGQFPASIAMNFASEILMVQALNGEIEFNWDENGIVLPK